MSPVTSLAIRPAQCERLWRAIKRSKTSPGSTLRPSSIKRAPNWPPIQKKDLQPSPEILLAQNQEIQQVMARFQAAQPNGVAVAQLEILVRTAVFKTANELVGWMLQQAVDRIDAAYQPKPGEQRKDREVLKVQGIFGHFPLNRDYYHHPGKKQGHHPADAALGLEVGYR